MNDKDRRNQTVVSTGGKILWFIFRLFVSVAIVVWIFKSIDVSAFTQAASSPKVIPAIAMVAFALFFVFLGGMKLWILMRGFSPISLKRFMAYFFLAGSVGSLVPAIVGDFTLIGLAKSSKVPIHQSVAAIIMDRFITIFIAVFIFTPFTLALVTSVSPPYVILLTAASVLLSGGLVWIIYTFAPFILGKVEIIKNFWKAFSLYFTTYRKDLSINMIICGLRGIVSGFTLIFALMAVDLSPPVFTTICISNSLSIITHIPVSMSGLGFFEGGGLLLFEAIGMNRERVLAGLFYHRLYIMIWASLTAVVLISVLSWKKRMNRSMHDDH